MLFTQLGSEALIIMNAKVPGLLPEDYYLMQKLLN
jgi:hypothetical protein